MGNVVEVFSAKKGTKGLRPVVDHLELIEGHGIKDDKFADKDLEATVMIIGVNTYEIAKNAKINLDYGSFGENILINFDPHILATNTILTIGTAKIMVTKPCTICSHLAIYDDKLPNLIAKYRGVYCKVITSGVIKKGDTIINN